MQLEVGNLTIKVILKDIKNIHLSVLPPDGQVRISAPLDMKIEAIRIYVIGKLQWIRKEQEKIKSQVRETPREFVERESHCLWGKRYLLDIIESESQSEVKVKHSTLALKVKPGTSVEAKETIMDAFYREELRKTVEEVMPRFESLVGVNVKKLYIQRMKTKWGSCNPKEASIRLNSELAKKPVELVEYVVAHELCHLVDPTHGDLFLATMDKIMPTWRHKQDELNSLPLRHETWARPGLAEV